MSGASKQRLDKELLERGLIESRQKAQELIKSGKVTLNGKVERRPSTQVSSENVLEVTELPPFVSRAGEKLEGALRTWGEAGPDISGKAVLDIGASTGGFTDCVLQRGASEVTCVDVGHDQLHPKIKEDERVTSHEGLNARHLEPECFGILYDLIVLDVSFISQRSVLPAVLLQAADEAELISLVKPQFEVGKENVAKGGIVKDSKAREQALREVEAFINDQLGWKVVETITSQIEGSDGNQEFLLWAKKSSASPSC